MQSWHHQNSALLAQKLGHVNYQSSDFFCMHCDTRETKDSQLWLLDTVYIVTLLSTGSEKVNRTAIIVSLNAELLHICDAVRLVYTQKFIFLNKFWPTGRGQNKTWNWGIGFEMLSWFYIEFRIFRFFCFLLLSVHFMTGVWADMRVVCWHRSRPNRKRAAVCDRRAVILEGILYIRSRWSSFTERVFRMKHKINWAVVIVCLCV